jgi:hypothetical protein
MRKQPTSKKTKHWNLLNLDPALILALTKIHPEYAGMPENEPNLLISRLEPN